MAAAERGEAGSALLERAKAEGEPEAAPLDPQQLEKELLLAREAVTCKKSTHTHTNSRTYACTHARTHKQQQDVMFRQGSEM